MIIKELEDDGCDSTHLDRTHSNERKIPGAIWHIFRPEDNEKI